MTQNNLGNAYSNRILGNRAKNTDTAIAALQAVKMSLNRRLHKIPDDAQPFKSPFYWAAFCAIGQ